MPYYHGSYVAENFGSLFYGMWGVFFIALAIIFFGAAYCWKVDGSINWWKWSIPALLCLVLGLGLVWVS